MRIVTGSSEIDLETNAEEVGAACVGDPGMRVVEHDAGMRAEIAVEADGPLACLAAADPTVVEVHVVVPKRELQSTGAALANVVTRQDTTEGAGGLLVRPMLAGEEVAGLDIAAPEVGSSEAVALIDAGKEVLALT